VKPTRNLMPAVVFGALAPAAALVAALLVSCSPDSTPPRATPEEPAGASAAGDRDPPSEERAASHDGAPIVDADPASPSPATVPPAPRPDPGLPLQPPAFTAASPEAELADSSDGIQVSFQGANIDMVVQWLAKTTGKSVVKHPRVQCQLTIVSSRKLPLRDALSLVYRALSLEGFATIESSDSILIVPDGQEPSLSPELMTSTADGIPEGRQRLLKVFTLEHVPAAELRDRVRGLLSDKGTIEADDRGNRVIVTDYTDTIRLLTELIPELDIVSASETVIEIYAVRHLEAEELASLLNLVLSEGPGTAASPPRTPQPTGAPPGMPPGMPPGAPPRASPPQPSGSPSTAPAADQKVRLWPDKTSNRLIVSAPRSRIAEIENLIQILDAEKPADVALRVLPLKNVSAVDLLKDLAPLYQRMSGQSLKDTIEVTADELANAFIILSSEANFLAIQQLVARLDTEDAQEKVVRTFPLRNADAEDVAQQLRDLSQDQTPATRFVYYFPQSPSTDRSRRIGVVADRRRNTVIVQAPPAALPGIADMIRALDEPVTDDTLAPKIIPLKYVSAVDLEDVLNQLFLKRQQQRSYWDYYYDAGTSQRDQDAGRLYGKVRITSEPYSNSIIITANSPENLAAVESMIEQLDVPSQAGESTIRIGLKFAEAVAVANSLNILFARGGSPPLRPVAQPGQPADPRAQPSGLPASQGGFQLERERKEDTYYPWLGGPPENLRSPDGSTVRPASDLIGRVRVVPDSRSNALLLTANVHFFPQVLKLVEELDVPTPQVMIEAKIIEVSSDFRDRMGVRWSPDGSRTFDAEDYDGSLMPSASAEYMRVFTGSLAPGALRSGVLDASLNLDVLIQFLRKTTDATVVGEPQISVSDNELGRLFVGAQVPFISSSLNTQEGGRNDSFQYKDVGVILEVTPHINNANEVALRIHAESSNIRSGETLFGGAILDTRKFHTDVLVKNGQTVVLGGIIQREQADIVRKVPVLGDIPVLGWAFKKRDKLDRDVELMVFLRPVITRSPEEAQALLQEVGHRSPRLLERAGLPREPDPGDALGPSDR
jgi:type II secretion system protein D